MNPMRLPLDRTLNAPTLFLVLVMTCCHTDGLRAAPDEPREQPGWDFQIGLPLWASGLDGTTGVRGRKADVDEDFSDIVDILDFAAALNVEVRRQPWLLFANGLYAKTTTDAEPGGLLGGIINDVELEQKQFLLDFGLGYNITPRRPVSLELFAGGRLQYLDAEISVEFPASDASFSGSKTWIDPIFGLMAQWRLSRHFTLFAEGDAGGFGVASDLTWQAQGGLEWTINRHLYLRGGYRHLVTDFEDDGFTYDMTQGGPLLELGLRF